MGHTARITTQNMAALAFAALAGTAAAQTTTLPPLPAGRLYPQVKPENFEKCYRAIVAYPGRCPAPFNRHVPGEWMWLENESGGLKPGAYNLVAHQGQCYPITDVQSLGEPLPPAGITKVQDCYPLERLPDTYVAPPLPAGAKTIKQLKAEQVARQQADQQAAQPAPAVAIPAAAAPVLPNGQKWYQAANYLPPVVDYSKLSATPQVTNAGTVYKEVNCQLSNGLKVEPGSGLLLDNRLVVHVGRQDCSLTPLIEVVQNGQSPSTFPTAQPLLEAIASVNPPFSGLFSGDMNVAQDFGTKFYPGKAIAAAPGPMAAFSTLISSLKATRGIPGNQPIRVEVPGPCRVSSLVDTDGDGLPDEAEKRGFRDLDGSMFYSDPTKKDTDDDGLLDNEEVGQALTTRMDVAKAATARGLDSMKMDLGLCYHDVVADPRKKDTDSDMIEDGEELDEGSKPRAADIDKDGLNDVGERMNGTDPTIADTDGDGNNDFYEVVNKNYGYDPLTPDSGWTKAKYIAEFTKGFAAGEFDSLDTVPALMGSITSSVAPVIGTVADARDLLGSAIKLDVVGVSLSLVGMIPAAGDYVKATGRVTKFFTDLAKSAHGLNAASLNSTASTTAAKATDAFAAVNKADEALAAIASMETPARSVLFKTGMDIMHTGVHDRLTRAGLSSDSIERLARGSGRASQLRHLANVLDNCNAPACIKSFATASKRPHGAWSPNWREAEVYVNNGSGVRPKRVPPNPEKGEPYRFYDGIDVGNAKEAKTGYVTASKDGALAQIKKDCYMKQNRHVIGLEWHFFPSGASNSLGAAPEVINALRSCNIPFTLHLP